MEVWYTREFEKYVKKMDRFSQWKVNKAVRNIWLKSGKCGNPLSGLPFFREVRMNGKRLYFLLYEQTSKIVLVAVSNKKAQQATINAIARKLKKYREYYS